MRKQSEDTTGFIGTLHIVILSIIVALLLIVYFGIYSLFNLLLSPIHSVFGATLIYLLLFIFVTVYRIRNGPLVDEDDIKSSPLYREPMPTIPDIDVDPEEDDSVVTTENFDDQEIDDDGGDEFDIDDDDVPKELYIKVVQEDGYTMADAKRETLERREN